MLFLLSYTGGGNVSWCSNRGEQYDVPQKIKNRMTIRSSSRTPGHLFRRNCSSKRCVLHYVHSSTFTTAKSWRQRKCPSTWMDTDDGGACTRWNTAQPQRRRKQCHLQQHGWDDHTKQSPSERERRTPRAVIYMWPNDPLEKKATVPRCRDPAWETPWTEEPGRLESMRLRRGGHDWETKQQQRQIWYKWTCLRNRNSCRLTLATREGGRRTDTGGGGQHL